MGVNRGERPIAGGGAPYHVGMSDRRPTDPAPDERDWIDSIPGMDRVATNLQRSFGPSCFLSLVISALILILLRQYVRFGILGTAVFTLFVWWVVMVILVRFSGGNPVDDDY